MKTPLQQRIRDEIDANPDGRYTNKTPAEIVQIMNEPITKKVTEDVEVPVITPPVTETKSVTTTTILEAPVLALINGIPNAANLITEEDVTEALK